MTIWQFGKFLYLTKIWYKLLAYSWHFFFRSTESCMNVHLNLHQYLLYQWLLQQNINLFSYFNSLQGKKKAVLNVLVLKSYKDLMKLIKLPDVTLVHCPLILHCLLSPVLVSYPSQKSQHHLCWHSVHFHSCLMAQHPSYLQALVAYCQLRHCKYK